jgi:ribosomal protein S6--L-glutamate ligase
LKAALLTRSPEAPGNRRLAEAARERGDELLVLDTLAPLVVLSSGQVRVGGEPLASVEAVLPRYGPELQPAGLVVQRALEQAGAASLGPAAAFERARDKCAALAAFVAAGLPVPPTAVVSDPAQAEAAVEQAGGGAVVVKPARGWRGAGLWLERGPAAAVERLREAADARSPLLVQRFVEEAAGRALRVLVLEGRVLAAARFEAAGEDFRANAAAGGVATPLAEPGAAGAIAVAAAGALGLGFAGVDLIESRDGPLLLEANAAPGFAAVEAATGADVAGAVLEALERARA